MQVEVSIVMSSMDAAVVLFFVCVLFGAFKFHKLQENIYYNGFIS